MFGPHLIIDSMQCTLCEKRIPIALAASGCPKNKFDYKRLAEEIAVAIFPSHPEENQALRSEIERNLR